jgi:hypothetical protein
MWAGVTPSLYSPIEPEAEEEGEGGREEEGEGSGKICRGTKTVRVSTGLRPTCGSWKHLLGESARRGTCSSELRTFKGVRKQNELYVHGHDWLPTKQRKDARR